EAGTGRVGRPDRRYGHQPAHVEAQIAQTLDQAGDETGLRAATGRVVGEVHLHEHRGARRAPGELLPDAEPVDRLPEADQVRDLADLVSLQPADEVPVHRRGARL